MKTKRTIETFFRLSSVGIIVAFSSQLYAAGYKMEFQSVSTLADAGEAAVVQDAGTNWYNSAGLVYLPQQLVVSVMDVYAPVRFTGQTTGGSVFGPAFQYHASGSASSHPNAVLPAIHYSMPIKDQYAFGLSIVPAWGFMEDYGSSSILRYDITKIETQTIDVAPSISWKINHQWSIGAGPDLHYFSVKSKTHVYTQGAPGPFATANDSRSRFNASDWSYGGHIGLLFQSCYGTRVGINYRSKIVMDLDGSSTFELDGVGTFSTNLFKLQVPLPPTTTLSVYQELTPQWAIMGTAAYDEWSVLDAYRAHNYIQPPSPLNPSGLIADVTQPQHMRNTLDLSFGAHYKVNDQWLLRGSFKHEPTPTNGAYRDVNFPDGEKFGFHIGSRYQMTKKLALDLIYGHVFVKKTNIHGVYPQQIYPNTIAAQGHARTTIDLAGAQLVWNI